MPVLETERLKIREFETGDLETYHRIANEGFGVHKAENTALEERRSWLEWVMRNYQELDRLYQPPYGDRAIVLKDDGRLIGSVGLVPAMGPFGQLPYFATRDGYEDRRNRPEFGLFWVIDPDCQRQGYATEAAQALVKHTFRELNLSRIVATTEHDNEPSMGVMRRLGMNIQKNPYPDPIWFQVVGVLENT
jgi:RimJ/RimL family protein N-acetyltransferase